MSLIIGVNCAHDASVCICSGGRIAFATCEDRISRRKHSSGFPQRALEAAIHESGAGSALDDAILVMNQQPPSDYSHEIFSSLPGLRPENVIVNPSHHLLHALYALAASGFEDSAVLVLDGSGYSYGEFLRRGSPLLDPGAEYEEAQEAWSLFRYRSGEVSVAARSWEMWVHGKNNRFRFPSIGHMYSLASQLIFGEWTHAGKVMGLAAFGDACALDFPIIHLEENGIRVDVDWVHGVPAIRGRGCEMAENVAARDLAAKVQSELERGVTHLCRVAQKLTGERRLCLTGGVALNTVCNTLIQESHLFDELFVTPAAHDAGVAIGAAAYGFYVSQGRLPDFSRQVEFLGAGFTRTEVLAALEEAAGVEYRLADDAIREGLDDFLAGRVVGWFEGRAEFGPRALGHRSILADPRAPDMKNRVNAAVKFREPFRPFAASILEEYVSSYFATAQKSPYMLFVAAAKPLARATVPAVIHVDGTCRLQTVDRSYAGSLRRLLEAFHGATGVPLLLNTSLNLAGEPLCEHPADAIRTLVQSAMDVLYLEGYRVQKRNRVAPSWNEKVPALFETVKVVQTSTLQRESSILVVAEVVLEVGREPTVRRRRLDDDERRVISAVNGRKTAREIVAEFEGDLSPAAVETALLRLNDAGALYFR